MGLARATLHVNYMTPIPENLGGTYQTRNWYRRICTVPQAMPCPLVREDCSLYSRNASACAGCQKQRRKLELGIVWKDIPSLLPS